LKLARRLDRYCAEQGRQLPVLLEFNTSGEQTKYGWPVWDEAIWDGLLEELNEITLLPNLEIRGLMTMAPYSESSESSRLFFRRLHKLREYLTKKIQGATWEDLSMGMSSDYEVAVEEGATWVRIGQAILGPRVCNI
jgi:uncharacterized pyridoxal phosphate-containing UPF0001 family protein